MSIAFDVDTFFDGIEFGSGASPGRARTIDRAGFQRRFKKGKLGSMDRMSQTIGKTLGLDGPSSEQFGAQLKMARAAVADGVGPDGDLMEMAIRLIVLNSFYGLVKDGLLSCIENAAASGTAIDSITLTSSTAVTVQALRVGGVVKAYVCPYMLVVVTFEGSATTPAATVDVELRFSGFCDSSVAIPVNVTSAESVRIPMGLLNTAWSFTVQCDRASANLTVKVDLVAPALHPRHPRAEAAAYAGAAYWGGSGWADAGDGADDDMDGEETGPQSRLSKVMSKVGGALRGVASRVASRMGR